MGHKTTGDGQEEGAYGLAGVGMKPSPPTPPPVLGLNGVILWLFPSTVPRIWESISGNRGVRNPWTGLPSLFIGHRAPFSNPAGSITGRWLEPPETACRGHWLLEKPSLQPLTGSPNSQARPFATGGSRFSALLES